MTKFKINSQCYSNLNLIKNIEFTNSPCNIHINNNKTIRLPILLAVGFSKLICEKLLNDLTIRDFYFDIPFEGDISDEFILKLEKTLNQEEVFLEDNEIFNFVLFGKTFLNNEFTSILIKYLEQEEDNINKENVLDILSKKISFNLQDNELSKEIDFISENFEDMKEKLINNYNNLKYFHIFQQILSNDKLKLTNEDSLLNFVLSLCAQSQAYETLFSHVHLEYCSIESIKSFINYIKSNVCNTNNLTSIFECIERRLIQSKIPVDNPQKSQRYLNKQNEIIYDDDGSTKGMFYYEHKKGNVDIKASSTQTGHVSYLISGTSNQFLTKNCPNSYVEISLKNKKQFTISKYLIKEMNLDPFAGHLKSWQIEGQKANGEKIVIDKRENAYDPFSPNLLRVFQVNDEGPFISIKLQQIGYNTRGDNYLCINAFDIFGKMEQ